MTDPSSQNPSDPDHASPENKGDDTPQKKLKLKQLLAPLSSHLNVEHHEDGPEVEEYTPRMEIPRAVPMEPEPELAPHERPPSPDGIPLPESELGMDPSGNPVGESGLNQPVLPQISNPENIHEEVQEPEEETIEELVSAPQKKPSRIKKIALPVIGSLLILAGIHYFFDPLGIRIEPITHEAPVILNEQKQITEQKEMPASMASVNLSLELEQLSTESFLKQLEEHLIITSENPKGAIIDSVFYPEGSALNPMLGLVLHSAKGSGKESSVVIVDADGKEYELRSN
jgi:hypothetical protein